MAKLTSTSTFSDAITSGAALPINLEQLTGTIFHVDTNVDWQFSTTWNANVGHGILTTEPRGNQVVPTPYFHIFNEGKITNTNSTVAPGSGTGSEAHNAIFLYKGGSVTNATSGLLEQKAADDWFGTVHFEKGNSLGNELYNDGTIRSGMIAVSNNGQFDFENKGNVYGNVYTSDGVKSPGQESKIVNDGNLFGKNSKASAVIEQAAVYMEDTKASLVNNGTIEASGRYGVYFGLKSSIDVKNTSIIEAKHIGDSATASYGLMAIDGGTIENSGTIKGQVGMSIGRTSSASAISNWDFSLTNSGVISSTDFSAIEARTLDKITITNASTGTIVSQGGSVSADGGYGIVVLGFSGRNQETKIVNEGLIKGKVGVGVVHFGTSETVTIENSGTIATSASSGTAISAAVGTKLILDMEANGTVSGTIKASGSADTLSFKGSSTVSGTVEGMETISVASGVSATVGGNITGFSTATIGSAGKLAVAGSISGSTLTLTGGRLEIDGTTMSTLSALNADNASELHITTLTTNTALKVSTAALEGVKLSIGSITGSSVTVMEIDGSNPVSDRFEGMNEGATFSVGGDNFAISYLGGDGNDIVLNRLPPANSGGGTPTTTTTIDGLAVTTSTVTNSDGSTSVKRVIPIATTAREESSGSTTVADIPLSTYAGSTVLLAQLPNGFGLTVVGTQSPKSARLSLADLLREIEAHTTDGTQVQTTLLGGGTEFLTNLSSQSRLTVHSIVPVVDGNTPPDKPLVISGPDQADGSPLVALVIDGSKLPAGTIIELHNVSFAVIIGPVKVQGGAGSQIVWGDDANQSIVLGPDDDELHGGAGDDTVGSGAGNDKLYGGDGNDVLFGGAGDDFIDGGDGFDVALYSGALLEIAIRRQADGSVLIKGPEGTDTLTNIERVEFSDGIVTFDTVSTDGVEGALYRLYLSAFGRVADKDGLSYWVDRHGDSVELTAVAESFLASDEFSKRFTGISEMSNIEFIDQLYANTFNRLGDAEGRQYWLNELDRGVARDQITIAFAQSDEAVAIMGNGAPQPIWHFA